MMRNPTVPDAMHDAYVSTDGDRSPSGSWRRWWPPRARAATSAAGSRRRSRSCARESGDDPWNDIVLDLRVEDHADPNTELDAARAHAPRLRAARALRGAPGRGPQTTRPTPRPQAALALLPENVEIGFWRGVQLCIDGRDAEARPLLDRAYAIDDGWRELVRRLPAAGLLADDAALVARILGG